jgi:hypothetical protein
VHSRLALGRWAVGAGSPAAAAPAVSGSMPVHLLQQNTTDHHELSVCIWDPEGRIRRTGSGPSGVGLQHCGYSGEVVIIF